MRTGLYLVNLSPRQELAFALSLRGNCCMDNFDVGGAVEAFHHASTLYPEKVVYRHYSAICTIMARFIGEMRRQYALGSDLKKLRMPMPKDPLEAKVYPRAWEEIQRILGNRRRRMQTDTSTPQLPLSLFPAGV